MSPRARAWLGGILFALGVVAFLGGSLFPGLSAIADAGIAAAVVALVVIGWAFRDVTRQIGAGHARFEAMLRAEAERGKAGLPPKGK